MSEATIQSGIQTTLQAMSEFADADIVINEWGILDQAVTGAPYVIITNSDSVDSRQDTRTANTKWSIPITLYEAFTDWATSFNNFRTRRQAIIDAYNGTSTARSAGITSGVTIDRIRNDGDIGFYFDKTLSDEELRVAMPIFLYQTLILEAEEY